MNLKQIFQDFNKVFLTQICNTFCQENLLLQVVNDNEAKSASVIKLSQSAPWILRSKKT
jgi:hypothetical protein